jgi:hypothetical protein
VNAFAVNEGERCLDPKYEDTLEGKCEDFKKWHEAREAEMDSIKKFNVCDWVPVTEVWENDHQLLVGIWVNKVKLNKHMEIDKYRSRFVVCGNHQREGDSYDADEISSPVVHKDSLRTFLSLAAGSDLKLFQADVKAAFLQAPLNESIYVKAPQGYERTNEDGVEMVMKLTSALYSLKQAAACFWNAMSEHLISLGYESTIGDPCLFKRVLDDGQIILLCVYVDDITYAVPDDDVAAMVLAELRQRFVIGEGEGMPIEFLLGIAIHQDLNAGTVKLDMEMMITKLAQKLLTPEEMVKSRNVHTPMLTTPLEKSETRTVPKSEFDYLSVVGSLMHFANCVRFDVATAVNILASHSMTPTHQCVNAVKRVVMYLYNYRGLGITYSRCGDAINLPLIFEHASEPGECQEAAVNLPFISADSDYAMEQGRSRAGKVITMNNGPISWFSVLGKAIATSTCEAEVNAAVMAVKDAIHIKQLLVDLGVMKDNVPLYIAEDNSACISQANSGIKNVRNAKHYQVKLRYLQQQVHDGVVKFLYCPTDFQLSDIMTKPLEVEKFTRFRDILMGMREPR